MKGNKTPKKKTPQKKMRGSTQVVLPQQLRKVIKHKQKKAKVIQVEPEAEVLRTKLNLGRAPKRVRPHVPVFRLTAVTWNGWTNKDGNESITEETVTVVSELSVPLVNGIKVVKFCKTMLRKDMGRY